MVALIAEAVSPDSRPRAQAVVNSGTGAGVVLSGPLALAGHRRAAWLCFAVLTLAATTTVWAASASGSSDARPTALHRRGPTSPLRHLRSAIAAAALVGAGSAAVWTFGRELVVTSGSLDAVGSISFWTALGAAGLGGALVGDAVQRWDITRTWMLLALLLAASTLLLVIYPGVPAVAFLSGAVFGATYIGLSGVLIAWGTRCQPTTPATATASLFIVLTLGQAVGAALTGALLESTNPSVAFTVAAIIAACSGIPAARVPIQGGESLAGPDLRT